MPHQDHRVALLPSTQTEEPDCKKTSTEYGVDHIVVSQREEKYLRYRIGLFGYTPEHDVLEPPEHILQDFIYRHRRKK